MLSFKILSALDFAGSESVFESDYKDSFKNHTFASFSLRLGGLAQFGVLSQVLVLLDEFKASQWIM